MGMNQTPASERLHISFFGRRNAGKSSVINAVTGQDLAIVSQVEGTTTDPVYKTMELLPIGPVMVIDTPGIDDEGDLGQMRVRRSYQVLNKTDVAVLVIDATKGIQKEDQALIARFQEKKIPYLIAYNKCDLLDTQFAPEDEHSICISAKEKQYIQELKETIGKLGSQEDNGKRIVADLICPGDLVVLVVPVDKAAPKGRLILPQQQTIRDILDADAVSVVVKETALKETLEKLGTKPKLVITDSQAFKQVSADTPEDLMLTSFSILFSRYKGDLAQQVASVTALDQIQEGDRILIAEGCTHHRQCDDIGTVKMPKWIQAHTGVKPIFEYVSGTEFPEDVSPYKMIIHCGGCMLNEREMKYRLRCAQDQKIPMTNYGVAIAHMTGILARSLEPFPELQKLLEKNNG